MAAVVVTVAAVATDMEVTVKEVAMEVMVAMKAVVDMEVAVNTVVEAMVVAMAMNLTTQVVGSWRSLTK